MVLGCRTNRHAGAVAHAQRGLAIQRDDASPGKDTSAHLPKLDADSRRFFKPISFVGPRLKASPRLGLIRPKSLASISSTKPAMFAK